MNSNYNNARKEIQEAQLTKNATNPHFKNTYANLAAHQELVLPILQVHNLEWRCRTRVEDGLLLFVYGVWNSEEDEYIESGEYILGTSDSKPQEMGSAITYARRYVFSLFFNLNAEDDDGNSGSGIRTSQQETSVSKMKPEATTTKRKLY